MNDAELLRRYAQEGSQEAFAELVNMRIGLVYSAALRQTGGDANLAQDVTQAVITDLALKAAALCRHRALVGWLFTSTRFAASKLVRSDRRRRAREQVAFSMREDPTTAAPEIPAERLRPLLDDAMHQLSEIDRQALLLRFFDGRSMAELGQSFGITEPAAQKRVERALEKLRALLTRRGLKSTAAAIGLALRFEAAATVVPSGLAATVSGNALVATSTAATGAGILSSLAVPLALTAGVAGVALAVAYGSMHYEFSLTSPTTSKPAPAFDQPAGKTNADTLELVDKSTAEAAETAAKSQNYLPSPDRVTSGPTHAPERLAIVPAPPAPLPFSPANPNHNPDRLAVASLAVNWSTDSPAFDPSQLDQQPVPTVQTRPVYPPAMRHNRIPGRVVVDFIVDDTGQVRNAVAANSTRSEFEQAAIDAVTRWKFTPGRRGGRAVNTHMQVPIVFTINSND